MKHGSPIRSTTSTLLLICLPVCLLAFGSVSIGETTVASIAKLVTGLSTPPAENVKSARGESHGAPVAAIGFGGASALTLPGYVERIRATDGPCADVWRVNAHRGRAPPFSPIAA